MWYFIWRLCSYLLLVGDGFLIKRDVVLRHDSDVLLEVFFVMFLVGILVATDVLDRKK